jgi:hypothetical protein
MRLAAVVLAVVACLPAAGCGESGDDDFDRTDPRAVVERAQQAVADEDAETLCRELILPGALGTSDERCESEFASDLFGTPEAEVAANHELGEVEITENTARVENLTTGGFTELVKEDGRWYLVPVR